MYIPFFYVICLRCVQVSSTRDINKSRLCVVPLDHPRMHSPTWHFSHFVWMVFFLPRAKQTRHFILLSKKFAQWCQLASSRRNIVEDKSKMRVNRKQDGFLLKKNNFFCFNMK
jgi:hypothetical protein